MTPFHIDLLKYSAPAAPTAQERQALSASRHARRAAFSACIEKVFLHILRFAAAVKRLRLKSPS